MKVVIIGHGGHGKVVKELLDHFPEHELIGFLDDRYSRLEHHDGYLCGPMSFTQNLLLQFYNVRFINAIGDNRKRKEIVEYLDLPAERYLTLVHPTAVISSSAIIGEGTVIMPNAVINSETKIQNHVIINSGAIVEHDGRVENFSHISPNATLTGGVKVEEGVHIGSGATVLPGVKIGQWSVIGAGATVLHDISSFKTAVGVPARVVKEKAPFLREVNNHE
ncbi:acetyltransferase [Pullulanibacillus sp. KACC 23026]|uniref:acetyltransferase n=1 Tax=Pullulanibacillus sp. KACC 23026 TaxID=3028315 RepID=UPI0023B16E48|nr:acetyltransferase [Pullulanibacillus sp. KACC 23026]WEG11513.1 acetyltransferase [Pullulanibacillus sp. KACC 23026]